jgi:hypothetical protein
MGLTKVIKALIKALILLVLLNSVTIHAAASSGAGIDFIDPDQTPTPTPTPVSTQTPTPTPQEILQPPAVTPAPAPQPLPPQPPPAEQIPPEAPPIQPPLPQDPPPQDPPETESTDFTEIEIIEQEVPQAPIEVDEITPPRASIFGIPLLLFAPPGIRSWALLNLIMSIAGILLVVITTLRLLIYKRKEDKRVNDGINNSFNEEFENPESNDPSKKFRLTWFTLGAVAALTAVIVFILTQDITAIIALTDWWTIIHLVLLAVVVVSCAVIFRGQKEKTHYKKGETS